MQTRDRLFIGNEWVAPATDRTIDVISPITEEVYARTPDGSPADIDRAVAAARDAFDNGPWPHMTPERAGRRHRRALAGAAEARRRDRRHRHQRERRPGPAVTGHAGVRGDDGARRLRRHRPQLSRGATSASARWAQKVVVRRAPVGVCAGIIPWNVPLFIMAMKLGPCLASGSTMVLKPAPETPLDPYLLAEAVLEAGLPPGVINIVPAAARPASTSSPTPASTRSASPVRRRRARASASCAARRSSA